MELLSIYDGRTLGEFNSGREFFTRAKFKGDDGTLYEGWKDGPRYRFFTVEYPHASKRPLKRLLRKDCALEKQLVALMVENECNAIRWQGVQS